MADIELYEDDSEDSIESDVSGDVGFEDYDSDPCDPDASLTMLQRLEKYCQDDNMYTRQMVTRSLLETIKTIESDEEAEILLLSISKLADDPEVMVRSELMEHIPHIAIYCLENIHIFGDPIPTHLLPIVVKYITDNYNQVRKTSQAALLVLLEQDMIKRDDVEEQVCPVILQLGQAESLDDFRTEAAALMSKLAPLIGKEATERLFLTRFSEMCTDALFHVRKVCATNFGDFCQVVGMEHTENILLQKFFYLCEDGVWGVRKACAECFMQVACVCSISMRRSELAQLFVNLICDQSRWVRMAAFQALGGFISTFADPSNTGLYFNDEGLLMVGSAGDFIKREMSEDSDSSSDGSCDNSDKASLENNINNTSRHKTNRDSYSGLSANRGSPMHLESLERVIELTSNTIQMLDLDKSVEERRANSHNSSKPEDARNDHTASPDSSSPADAQLGKSNEDRSSCSHGASDNQTVPEGTPLSKNEISDLPCSSSSANDTDLGNKNKVHIHMDNNTSFNTFQFWRMPLPEIDVDVDIVDGKAANIHIKTMVKDTDTSTALVSRFDVTVSEDDTSPESPQFTTSSESTTEAMEVDQSSDSDNVFSDDDESKKSTDLEATDEQGVRIHTACVSTVCETVEEVANFGSTHILGHHVNESALTIRDGASQGKTPGQESPAVGTSTSEEHDSSDDIITLFDQDVIPQALLDHYLSMTDPSRAQTVDSEIAKHCAYSLPAVAYTLGRQYWPCLKELYERLAADMQWKVRRTLAFSIHELAVIVGEEVTSRDLMPVFNGFLKDLDEVRIGVLKHFADFLKLLQPDERQDYLTKIYEFLNTDNTRNWRFREELAVQLQCLLQLYSAADITDHLVPVAFTLADDGVASVRQQAFTVLSAMIARLHQIGDTKQLSALVNDIKQRFAHSQRWTNRQMYIHICRNVLEDAALPADQFAVDMFPSMLALAKDPIPNIRIALSRTLSKYIINSEYFTSGLNPLHQDLLETIQALKCDKDRDVRHFLVTMSDSTDLGSDTIPV